MFTQRRSIGMPGAESLAHAQRVIAAVMDDLSRHPKWHSPFKRVTVHAAVDRCVSSMIRAGETSDDVMRARALETVLLASQ